MPNLPKEFQDAIDQGLVSCRKHPVDDLWILNYTPECQFSRTWNDVTMQCRGLIVDANGQVVSRPFRKFFNLSEHDNPEFERVPIGSSFEAYEKMDGSLGISYFSSGGWEIATRGSFESDQANFATSLLSHKYSEAMLLMDRNVTYLFEIIYKENRVVVDYGDTQELVLLGAIETVSGKEIDLENLRHLPFRQPRVFQAESIEDLPKDIPNFEGFVVRFDNGLRVKVKLDEYVRLHKLVCGITPKRLWEGLQNGDDVDGMIKDLPDELYKDVTAVVKKLREDHEFMVTLYENRLWELELDGLTRKEQAQKILDFCKRDTQFSSSPFFCLLDGRKDRFDKLCWQMVEPKSNDRICKVDTDG